MQQKYLRVGKIRDAHGLKGELFVIIFAGEAEWIEQMQKPRIVDDKGFVLELTRKSVRWHQTQGRKGIILNTEELKDRTAAEALRGRFLEIPEDFLVAETGEMPYLFELLDMKVFVSGRGEVGKIVDFSTNVAQDLMVIETADGEFDVPLVEDFVQEINFDSKEIHLDLPLGLLGEKIETVNEQQHPQL